MTVSDQVVNALAVLRSLAVEHGGELKRAVDTLDNGGVFKEIDESTDYDVTPESVHAGCPGFLIDNGILLICTKCNR